MDETQETENNKKIVRTGVRMDATIHKALTDRLQERRYTQEKLSIDAAITEAVRLWLSRPQTPTATGSSLEVTAKAGKKWTLAIVDENFKSHRILEDLLNDPQRRAQALAIVEHLSTIGASKKTG